MAKVNDGSLSVECAGTKFLLTFELLECVNCEATSHFCVNHNRVVLFVTGTGYYMVQAANHLKMSYPRMIHITCMGHKSRVRCIHFLSPPDST